jgi:glycosyltransferase involved in cell wall biosynthesis
MAMRELHICLRMTGSLDWVGGLVYIQNLALAIASLPEQDRKGIKLSISTSRAHAAFIGPIQASVDRVYYWENFLQRAYFKSANFIAVKVPFIPRHLFDPRRFDFVYPENSPGRAPYRRGSWITDFQHRRMPQFFSQREIEKRNQIFEALAQSASVTVLSSRMAQEDFCFLYPQAACRSAVLNFVSSIDPQWFDENPKIYQEKYGLPDDFFLVANQFWKHKDHRVVIEALGLLKHRGIHPTVVCTGSTADYRHPGYFKELLLRIEQLSLGKQVRILGLIPRLDQVQLMRRSLAFIQPSLFEGWSTIVEEARLLGKTILLSDFPVHLEQNPPNSYFFQRGNAEELTLLMGRVLSSAGSAPDLEKEWIGRVDNMTRVKAFGRNFLHIVRHATDC